LSAAVACAACSQSNASIAGANGAGGAKATSASASSGSTGTAVGSASSAGAGASSASGASGTSSAGAASGGGSGGLVLVQHETFDTPFAEPTAWTEDPYGDASPYNVDAFDEDGDFFRERGGTTFAQGLKQFRSFRKSFRYGTGGWLTVELY